MKAKDWKFEKYIPDTEDIDAGLDASEIYFALPKISGRNRAEESGDAFHAGFNRGIAWQVAKLKESKSHYAKVEDNFGENDKGKEKFIGKIGLVLQVCHDYSCFSQVLLKFEDGMTEWFSNTALEEVAEDGGRKLITIEETIESVMAQYKRALQNFGSFVSPHEGFAVILEELDELWDDVKQNKIEEACAEALEVAACAIRFVMDIGNKEEDEE